jgi:hypothetical protein
MLEFVVPHKDNRSFRARIHSILLAGYSIVAWPTTAPLK